MSTNPDAALACCPRPKRTRRRGRGSVVQRGSMRAAWQAKRGGVHRWNIYCSAPDEFAHPILAPVFWGQLGAARIAELPEAGVPWRALPDGILRVQPYDALRRQAPRGIVRQFAFFPYGSTWCISAIAPILYTSIRIAPRFIASLPSPHHPVPSRRLTTRKSHPPSRHWIPTSLPVPARIWRW